MHKPDFCIFSEIDAEMARAFAEKLLSLKKKSCSIWISSIGGDIESAMTMAAILDAVRSRGIKVHMHVSSVAYSSAAYLLQLADRRTIAPHAAMLIHEAYSEITPEKIEQFSAREHFYHYQTLRAYTDAMFKAISKRSGLSLEEIDQKLIQNKMQWFLAAEEIIENNLADEVINFAHFEHEESQDHSAGVEPASADVIHIQPSAANRRRKRAPINYSDPNYNDLEALNA